MRLTGIREQVFLDRYALKDKEGKPVEKTPEEMWRRVARGIAKAEKNEKARKFWEKKFYEAMVGFSFVPAGRILAGAGTPHHVTFFNCFVLPSPEDSRKGIIKTLEYMAEIMAKGGGVGVNLSSLRPRGSYIKTVNGTSSGPVSWAELYSVATGEIIQQGGSRRGALMLMLNDDHPDIEEFISAKRKKGVLEYANLSVGISDNFMRAVEEGKAWELKWEGEIKKRLPARELWETICESAWACAEPGVVFLDRLNKMSNTWYFDKIIGVNVCGEQPLPAWGICNLGALNLTTFLTDGFFDFEKLKSRVAVAVRFMDDVIDVEEYLYPEMEKGQKRARRIGIGTMGLADALITLKIRYGSPDSLGLIERIYKTIRDAAYETSIELSREKGAFPAFEREKFLKGEFTKILSEETKEGVSKHGIRNATLLTQAPTGKTSLLAGVSSGIEPVFAFSYKQKDRLGGHLIYHPLYNEWEKENPTGEKPDYFVTATELTPEEHIKVQALIQRYTDASISKTVNAPNSHTVGEVKKLYKMVYDLGCKGITYMREGSREAALERIEEKKERPLRAAGATYKMETPVGTAYVTVNENGRREPLEIFVTIGKAGSDISAVAEAIGRLVSLVLRVTSPLSVIERARQIVDQLGGIGGAKSLGFGKTKIRSLPDAVAKAVATHFGIKTKNGNGGVVLKENGNEVNNSKENIDICPKCGQAALAYEEGCRKCYLCGYSEC